eukprot:scpid63439/ scgid13356/ 
MESDLEAEEAETSLPEDDDWAEFASHGADPTPPASVNSFPVWRKVLSDSFPNNACDSDSSVQHVPILAKTELQEEFMSLIMKRDFERETSLPGRSSLWQDLLPMRNFLTSERSLGSNQPCLESVRTQHNNLTIALRDVSFELELPSISGSTPMTASPVSASPMSASPASRSPDINGVVPRMFSFGLLNPNAPGSQPSSGLSSDLTMPSKDDDPFTRSQSFACMPTGASNGGRSRRMSANADSSSASRAGTPEIELGFAQDVAAKGLARLPLDLLQEMHHELTDKAHHLSDELINGLEARDRLLRTTKTRNEFVAAYLSLQTAVSESKSRKNSDSRAKAKRGESSASNKFLSAKLMYKGDASLLKPSTLERLTGVMSAMAAGSNDVSSLMSKYLAIDVFETDQDDSASPPISPYVASPMCFVPGTTTTPSAGPSPTANGVVNSA